MKRLLFVDDEPRVLAGLTRMLYPFRHEWNMEFVSSGAEALHRLSQADFDGLITDIQMPGMNGVELLRAVVERHPSVVRVVLSGTADRGATLPAVALAHQYLVKPCDAEVLRKALQKALVLRFLPDGTGLQTFVTSLQSLPSLPAAYRELLNALESPDVSAQEVGAAITRDVALTAKVMQLVNSAYFGLQRPIRNPVDAVVYLGTEVTRAVVLSVSVFSQFDRKVNSVLRIAALRDHSLGVATLGREIAKVLGIPRVQLDDVFTGGILHDLGELVFASHSPEFYREVAAAANAGDDAATDAETRLFGATHAQVGAYLLWLWGLPDLTTQIVALHHGPLPAPGDPAFRPIVAVRVADSLLRNRSEDDLKWLGQTEYAGSLPEWRALAEDFVR